MTEPAQTICTFIGGPFDKRKLPVDDTAQECSVNDFDNRVTKYVRQSATTFAVVSA